MENINKNPNYCVVILLIFDNLVGILEKIN